MGEGHLGSVGAGRHSCGRLMFQGHNIACAGSRGGNGVAIEGNLRRGRIHCRGAFRNRRLDRIGPLNLACISRG